MRQPFLPLESNFVGLKYVLVYAKNIDSANHGPAQVRKNICQIRHLPDRALAGHEGRQALIAQMSGKADFCISGSPISTARL
jgi:hypothetical protein